MSHERGQRTPGTPGKDAAAASSPTKKKMEYMTGVMPPGIKKCGLNVAAVLQCFFLRYRFIAFVQELSCTRHLSPSKLLKRIRFARQ